MDDNKNFYKYINEKSILVINIKGELKRIYCPFAVTDSGRKLLTVTAIASDNNEKIYYNINGSLYIYSLFKILN